jgi:hypothetical protein
VRKDRKPRASSNGPKLFIEPGASPIRVARRLKAINVIDVLSDLFILRGVPGHIRSDNGPRIPSLM